MPYFNALVVTNALQGLPAKSLKDNVGGRIRQFRNHFDLHPTRQSIGSQHQLDKFGRRNLQLDIDRISPSNFLGGKERKTGAKSIIRPHIRRSATSNFAPLAQ